MLRELKFFKASEKDLHIRIKIPHQGHRCFWVTHPKVG
jgi:hypothetical protein